MKQRIFGIAAEPSVLKSITIELEAQGFAVFPVASGEGALPKGRTGLPSLILIDLTSRKVAELEFAERWRGSATKKV